MTSSTNTNISVLKKLAENYSACDVSDALVKLKVPGAGFLADIVPLSTFHQNPNHQNTANSPPRLALPTSTILFTSLASNSPQTQTQTQETPTALPPSNIPPSTHWTDIPEPQTILLVQQPPTQSCAVVGDILATRLKLRGVRGVVVSGRVRDLAALSELTTTTTTVGDDGFEVWSRGTSTVGSGLEAKAWAAGVDVRVGNVVVKPGDVMFLDAGERGAVVIPRDKFDAVMEMLPALKAADDAVVADVQNGMPVQEAFKRHRG